MGLNLKNIGQQILHPFQASSAKPSTVFNPLVYINPLAAVGGAKILYNSLSAQQKQQAAKKAAAAGVPVDSLQYQAAPDGTITVAGPVPDATTQTVSWPVWAKVSLGVAIALTLAGVTLGIVKHFKNKE